VIEKRDRRASEEGRKNKVREGPREGKGVEDTFSK